MDINLLKNIKLKLLDRYILSQVIEIFVAGVVIFTSIIFASDTFITLIKQISLYGISFDIALMMILLNLPAVIIMTIPMSMLLSTVMSLNKLCLASEITVMRACSIGINRISRPIFIFAIIMAALSFAINETVVPMTNAQSKTLALWALGQKNIPKGRKNYILKELTDNNKVKRLFYVENCEKDKLENVTMLDLSKDGVIQVIQSKQGNAVDRGWLFNNGAIYTITKNGKTMNTTWFDESTVNFGLDLEKEMSKNEAKQYNSIQLTKHIMTIKDKQKQIEFKVQLYDKLAMPFTTIVFVLIGVPLSLTPPRVRYNRGFLFSILVIFLYYLVRALSLSFAETGTMPPFLAVWAPNIVLFLLGSILYYRKVYKIN